MYIKDMSQSLEQYHEFLKSQMNTTLFQTPEWGDVKTESEWTKEVLCVMNETDEPVAAAMILYRSLPVVKQYLAYAPRGIITDYTKETQFKEIIKTLKDYLKQKHVFTFKIDPEIKWHEWHNDYTRVEGGFDNEATRQLLLQSGFVHEPVDVGFDGSIQPSMTMIVDLKDEGKGIVDTWDKKERYKVTSAIKRGVVCYEGSIEDMDAYEQLNRITAERDHYIARSQQYLTSLYQQLHASDMMNVYFAKIDYAVAQQFEKNRVHQANQELARLEKKIASSDNPNRIEQLQKQKESLHYNLKKYQEEINRLEELKQAYPEGQLLSGAFVATYADTAYYLYGANITEDTSLNANKALQAWIMQKLYDEKGIRHYDMYGVGTQEGSHLGITKFKQSFDPELVEYIGEFDLPINRFWFTMFRDVAPKVLKWRRKLLLRR